MLAQDRRLNTKDVRYIQRQRKVIWTKHFGVLRIKQYPNRHYHQASIYIAAKLVPKAAWRHQLKRQLLPIVETSLISEGFTKSGGYYKLFIFLNKQAFTTHAISGTAKERGKQIRALKDCFEQERPRIQQKLH